MLNALRPLTLLCTLGLPLSAIGQESKPVKIIEPKGRSEAVKSASIDTEKFQIGAFAGLLSVEDFNSNPVTGISASYQVLDNALILVNYGMSEVERTTFEKREGLDFLTDGQRELTYFNVLGGYRLYTSRSFLGATRKYDSDIYLLAGLGRYDFAGDTNAGWVVGASYRVVLTDWLIGTLEFKDHFFKAADVFGAGSKSTQNLEWTVGFNVMF